MYEHIVGRAGLETTQQSSGKDDVSEQSGAKSGAVGTHSGGFDADLRAIIETWPTLSESIRAEILAIVIHSISVADNDT